MVISVLSYNIKGLSHPFYKNRLIQLVVENKIDIVCLQNLTIRNYDEIVDLFADKDYFCVEYDNDYVSYCLIFTKHKIKKHYNTIFRNTSQKRTFTRLCLDINDTEIWVGTAQMENIRENHTNKLDQIKEMQLIFKDESRCVLGLDTNFFGQETFYTPLTDNWIDSWEERGDTESRLNLDSTKNNHIEDDVIIHERTNRIIYKGLKCIKFTLMFEDRPLSEQFGIKADFVLE